MGATGIYVSIYVWMVGLKEGVGLQRDLQILFPIHARLLA